MLSVNHRFFTQTCTDDFTLLMTSNAKTYNIKVVDIRFLFLKKYMEHLFWINEAEDMYPEIQTVQKILGHEQICSQLDLGTDNYFSRNIVVDKVVDNYPSFRKSIRTLKSEFVCGRYHQNTKLDRNNSEPDKDTVTRCKTQTNLKTRSKSATR